VPRHLYNRSLFFAAATFNLASAFALVFFPEMILQRLSVSDPRATLLVRSLASSATTWGIGYALVALNAERFRILALLGAISKTFFTLVYLMAYLRGHISFAAFSPAIIEFLFALLFAEFLWHSRKPDNSPEIN
jgi:hypothetical protein